MVRAYKELASGTDVSTLTPGEITAYISRYLEAEDVDTSGLTPEAITAFVMAYEEATGGASVAALTPSGVVAMVAKYAEAEGVDLTALKPSQIEGIVSSFAEATGCDKSALLKEFTAYITEYKEAEGVRKPTLNVQIGLSGYDLLSYRRWLRNNKVEVEGIVRLKEVYEDPSSALAEEGVRFWKNGEEIPVTAVTADMLTADDVAVLDTDGTMHILISTEVTGAPEAIAEMREQVAEVDQLGVTALGMAAGIMPTSLMGFIDAAEQRIKDAAGRMGQWWNFIYGGDEGIQRTLDTSMQLDFNADRVAELATYVAEVMTAIKNGTPVAQEDIDNLQRIMTFVQDLDTAGVGGNITGGIAEELEAAGWDVSAETLASNLETAINSAFIIESPSKRMHPVGENVAAGIGEGASGYDFSTEAAAIASAIEGAITAALPETAFSGSAGTAMAGLASAMSGYSFATAGSAVGTNAKSAVSSSLTALSLRSVGVNAMAGLAAGIRSGQASVVSAMRRAASAAVSAAKSQLKIASPSRVFRDEVGAMTMKGFGEGVSAEAKKQASVISNAARYLTGAAKDSAIGFNTSNIQNSYSQDSSVTLSGNSFYVRDEQDIRSLAIEIATLTKRQQRGRGLRMA